MAGREAPGHVSAPRWATSRQSSRAELSRSTTSTLPAAPGRAINSRLRPSLSTYPPSVLVAVRDAALRERSRRARVDGPVRGRVAPRARVWVGDSVGVMCASWRLLAGFVAALVEGGRESVKRARGRSHGGGTAREPLRGSRRLTRDARRSQKLARMGSQGARGGCQACVAPAGGLAGRRADGAVSWS